MKSNIFDVLRSQADAIIQARNDQPWIEREHQHHQQTAELKQRDTNNEAYECTPTTSPRGA